MKSFVSPAPRAAYGLGLLTLVNFLNYMDRLIVAGAQPYIIKEFDLTDVEAGLITSVFVIVYMVASPLGGILGDRMPRRYLVAASVGLWSLATIGSGLAGTFITFLIARAIIGIGEAGYGAVAPAIISDLYPRNLRTRMLSFFYTAIPVGAAAGFAVGGWVAEHVSWHMAFFIGGAPGILVAIATAFMPEPERGATEEGPPEPKVPFLQGLKALGPNRVFWFTTAGYTLMTFAVGGLASWMPTFLFRERGIPLGEAGIAFGAMTALGGLFGTLAGGYLGDWADRRWTGGGLRVAGAGLIICAPFMIVMATVKLPVGIYAAAFAAQFFLFLNSGPINAAIVNCVGPSFRAFAMGLNVLLIHLLGDALSPTVIGFISQRSSLALAIILNAVPVVLGGLVLFVGAYQQATRPSPRPQLA